MGICAKCGAPVIDGDSWKQSYLAQLEQAQKLSRVLSGFRKLFRECLYQSSTHHMAYFFDEVDLLKCGLRKEIPNENHSSTHRHPDNVAAGGSNETG